MTAVLGITRNVGINSSPSSEFINTRNAAFKAIYLGYASDTSTSGNAETGHIGYTDGTNHYFNELFFQIPVPVTEIAGAKIQSATLTLKVINSQQYTGYTADQQFSIYQVRDTIDITDLTGAFRDATGSLAWSGSYFGGQPGVSFDAAPLATVTWTNANHSAAPSTGTPVLKTCDITAALQEAADAGASYLYLVARPLWDRPTTSVENFIRIDDPFVTGATASHSFYTAVYRPEVSLYRGRDDDRTKVDKSKFLYAAATDRAQHVQLGNVRDGAAGTPSEVFAANETESAMPRLVVISEGPHALKPRAPTAGARLLQAVRPLPTATNQGTTTGTLSVVRGDVDPAKWMADFTPLYGTLVHLTDASGGGNSEFAFNVDVSLWSGTTKICTIYKEWWDAGALASGWGMNVELLGDIRISTADVLTPTRVFLSNYYGAFNSGVTDDLASPYTAEQRRVDRSTVQQLRTTAYNATYSGNSRTHLEVQDAECGYFVTGARVTLFTAGMTRVIHSQIEHIYSRTDTPADTLVLNEAVSSPTDFVVGTGVVSGLLLGNLTAAEVAQVGVAAGAGAVTMRIDSVSRFASTSGTVRLTRRSDGAAESVVYTRSGLDLSFATGLVYAYAVGDMLEREVTVSDGYASGTAYPGTAPAALFYVQLEPEAGATRALEQVKPRVLSFAPRS